jgi:hypothetical protein
MNKCVRASTAVRLRSIVEQLLQRVIPLPRHFDHRRKIGRDKRSSLTHHRADVSSAQRNTPYSSELETVSTYS